MPVTEVTPGVAFTRHAETNVLFGCPPEVIKHLMIKGLGSPEVIVLPDTPYRFDVLQNCTEFPLYYFLFVERNFMQGKKLTIVGTPTHLKANRKLLRLTLDVGEGKTRNVFSGIRSSYSAEALRDRLVIVVCNLAPRKMRFGVSEGMVIAAGNDHGIMLLSPDHGAQPGDRVS